MKTIVCTFFLFFMTLLTALTVEDSRILAGIYFIFLERVIDQTWKAFNIKLGALWKDQEGSYWVRQILALFLIIICSNF